jgi:Rieske Fe-S protein
MSSRDREPSRHHDHSRYRDHTRSRDRARDERSPDRSRYLDSDAERREPSRKPDPAAAEDSATRRVFLGAAAGAAAGALAILAGRSVIWYPPEADAGLAGVAAPATPDAAPVAWPTPQLAPPTDVAPLTTEVAPPGSAVPSATPSGASVQAGIAKVGDIPPGGGVVIPAERLVLTQPTPGQFRAFDATCTHQGCVVADVRDGAIVCNCHGSQYSIADGSVRGGPAPRPLAPRAIAVVGDNVVLQ